MAKSDGWRTRDVREVMDRIEMEGVDRGVRRCGIQSVEQGCVEGIWSCVQGEILQDMWESMRERNRWSGRELSIWRTAGGERIGGGIPEDTRTRTEETKMAGAEPEIPSVPKNLREIRRRSK